MINKKSFKKIQQEAIDYLVENTPITQLESGGAARSMVDVFSRHLADFYTKLDIDLSMAYLTTASGFYLDLLGKLFGVSRTIVTNFNVLSEDKILKFYGAEGTLLSEHLPSMVIPAGTTVSTLDGAVTFTVSEDANFLQMDDHVFVSASPLNSSSYEKAGIGEVSINSIGISGVKATNLSPLTTGSETEKDIDYRARIASSMTSRQGANETAIRVAALSAPGVAEATVSSFSRGAGSFEVMVIPTGNRVPAASMEQIKSRVAATAALGVAFDVREPDYVQLKLEMRVSFDSTVSDPNKALMLRDMEREVLSYIGDVRPGGELSMARIQSIALETSASVTDAVVTYLCVDKKAQIIRNIRLEDDELIVPDENTANPIIIRT